VVGWLEVAPEDLAAGPAEVELELASTGRPTSSVLEQRLARRKLESRSDAAGFFQIQGVAPGEYRLIAHHPRAGTGSFFPVEVEDGKETALPSPVALHPPAPLQIGVSPAVDPHGKPWDLTILELNRDRTAIRSQITGKVDGEGFWRSRPLAPGPYRVSLASSDGSRWEQREVDVAGVEQEVVFFLDLVEVGGHLAVGEEPVPGTVWFGGRRGDTSLRMVSDEEGTFRGVLPRGGTWRVDVAVVSPPIEKTLSLEVRPPKGRCAAEVEIRLGSGEVEGEVLDEAERPVAGAAVWFSELFEASAGPRLARTDGKGQFRFAGVEDGQHLLRAYRFAAEGQESTPEVRVEVSGNRAAPRVRLQLQKQRRLRGVVLSSAGPVPGTSLSVSLPGSGGQIVPGTTSDVEGRFHLEVPPSLGELAITVLPPGLAAACLRLFPSLSGELTVPVADHGGTVRVRGTAVARRGTFRGLTLLVDGVPCSLGALSRWMATYGERGEVLLLPRLSPGLYQACWQDVEVPDSQARCEQGWLAPGGELILDLGQP